MKYGYLIVLLLFFPIFQLNSQIADEIKKINKDSLLVELPDLKGKDRIDALNKIAFKISYKKPDSCIILANQAIELSQTLNYIKGDAIGYFNLGNGYFFKDSLKLSVVNYLNALRIFENIDVCLEKGYTLHILSLLNWRAGKLEKSVQQTKLQIQIAHQLSDQHYKIQSMLTTSQYFTKVKKFDSADLYLDKALSLLQKYPDTIQLSWTYLYKGYNSLRNYDYIYLSANKESLDELLNECIYWLLKHIELENTFNFNSNTVFPYYLSIYYNLAWAYLTLDTYEDKISGLKYLYKAKNIVDTSASMVYYKLYIYRLLGKLKSKSGDHRTAIKICKEGIKKAEEARMNFSLKNYDRIDPFYWTIAEEFYYTQILSWTYARISYTYAKLGDYKNAHEFYVLGEKAKNEIFLEDNKNLIAML